MLCMTLQICNLFNIHRPMHYKDILPLERHNMQHKFLCDQNSKFTILLLKNSHFFFFLQHLQPVTISLKFSDTQESLTIADVSVCLGSLRKVHFNFVSIHILTLHSSPCSERNVFRCLIRTHSELVSDWLKVIRYLKKIEVISLGKCV